jgi:hypothetical protein
MRLRILPMLLAGALAGALPSTLEAQPFRSDDTGALISGGDLTGMHFPGGGPGSLDLQNALFRFSGGTWRFRSRSVRDAMLCQAAAVAARARDGALPTPRGWPADLSVDAPAQRGVYAVLVGEAGPAGTLALRDALAAGVPGPHADAAALLATSLAGLVAPSGECTTSLEAKPWRDALAAFEAYLDTAPPVVLDAPPPAFLVIAVFLQSVVDAGLAAARG